MTRKSARDIEKGYTNRQFAAKLRRIAVPAHAVFNIEHESSKAEEEIEFQIKWSRTRS